MRVWKRSILLFVGISVLLLSTLTVSAESDNTGDVWHWWYSSETATWGWEEHTGSKPNIDITSVSDTITGSEATLTMTVAGTIEDSDKIIYYIIMTAGGSSYMAYYVNEESYCIGTGGAIPLDNPVSGNTFTATFEIDNPSASYSVYGYAIEYKEVGDDVGEMWQDYAPNTYAPWYTSGDSDGKGGGTPGFEIITVIAALTIALIILRRRK